MLRPRTLPKRYLRLVPGLQPAARFFEGVAAKRIGRLPAGLALLLPFAILLDVGDVFDELVPVLGPLASLYVETAFVLGLTGNPVYAVGLAGIDLIPFVDVVPVATLTVLGMMWRALKGETVGEEAGPVIDVAAARVE